MFGKCVNSLAALSLVAACSSGCLFHRLEKPPRTAQVLPENVARRFGPPHSRTELTAVPNGSEPDSVRRVNRHYAFEQLTLTNVHQTAGRMVQLDYYLPNNGTSEPATGGAGMGESERCPAILILPIMGGKHYDLEAYFARSFAKRGFASVILHRPNIKNEVHKAEEVDDFLRRTVEDARCAIDWLESQPRIDPKRIGLFGISLGAIRGTLVVGLDPRVRSAVLGLGGGNLPYILTHTREKGLARQRDEILEGNNLSVQEGEEKLREIITCDPLVVAPAVDPSRVLMVIAACDKTVPARTGWELRRKLGNPATVQILSGHYTAVLYAPYLRWKTGRFFESQLGKAGER